MIGGVTSQEEREYIIIMRRQHPPRWLFSPAHPLTGTVKQLLLIHTAPTRGPWTQPTASLLLCSHGGNPLQSLTSQPASSFTPQALVFLISASLTQEVTEKVGWMVSWVTKPTHRAHRPNSQLQGPPAPTAPSNLRSTICCSIISVSSELQCCLLSWQLLRCLYFLRGSSFCSHFSYEISLYALCWMHPTMQVYIFKPFPWIVELTEDLVVIQP